MLLQEQLDGERFGHGACEPFRDDFTVDGLGNSELRIEVRYETEPVELAERHQRPGIDESAPQAGQPSSSDKVSALKGGSMPCAYAWRASSDWETPACSAAAPKEYPPRA